MRTSSRMTWRAALALGVAWGAMAGVGLWGATGCSGGEASGTDTGHGGVDAAVETASDGTAGDGTTDDATPGDGSGATDAKADGQHDGQAGDGAGADGTTDGDSTGPGADAAVKPPGQLGEACGSNGDCASGYCVPSTKGALCTVTCDAGCPSGWACREVSGGGGDLVTVCLPDAGRLCAPCDTDADCQGGLCLDWSGGTGGDGGVGRACTKPCDPEGGCDYGFQCEDRASELLTEGPTTRQCVPVGGTCDCSALNVGGARACSNQSAEGTCVGSQSCETTDEVTGAAAWSTCDAPAATAEVCDGADNDCDGLVDEDAAPPEASCEVTNDEGICQGAWHCAGEAGWSCDAATPSAETCDGADNDCDGETDEDFLDAASGLPATDEHCGACGNTCLGAFLHGVGACVSPGDGGAPHCEVASCEAGFYPASATTCLPVQDPSCVPCATDDACGGPGDRCVAMDDGGFCGRDCAEGNAYGTLAGACPGGFACSDLGQGLFQCLPATGSCACRTAEDAGVTRACVVSNAAGACQGAQVCDPAVGWSDCDGAVPDVEACNGVDDDCDGLTDEDVAPPTEACEVANDAGVCAGTWSCAGAQGWTCDAPTPAPESCNFADDDCDGQIDEDFVDAALGVPATDAHCGVCGNDCAGAFPHATSGCVVGDAGPSCAVVSCEAGYYAAAPTTCLPVVDTSCKPCTTDAHCLVPGDLCVPLDGATVCARDCGADNLYETPEGTCPDGFTCGAPDGQGRRVCLPTAGSCSCYEPDDHGATRPCAESNALGTCTGLQTCDAATGWSACSVSAPADETCNGLDDDCDGAVDEDVVEPAEACAVSNHLGECTAAWQCAGEGGWVCPAATPTAETCNGLDDDCDGAVDEDFKDGATGLLTDYDNCGLCGSSCAGAILYATSTACQIEGGQAVCVAVDCEPGYVKPAETDRICVPIGGAAPCSPCAADSHCQALVDGRCEILDGGAFCTRGCAVPSDCDAGYDCVNNRCLPATGSCSCLDPADGGKSRGCVEDNADGTCLGTQTCDPSASPGWSDCDAATPAAESCNGVDDDCDGLVDEGVAHDPAACSVTNAAGTCTGAWVCEGASGWTCTASTPSADVCDGVDNDCDGTADQAFRDPVTGHYVDDDNCGACGVSCAGAIPQATATCVDHIEAPRCEVAKCDPGTYQAGPLTCLPVVETLCQPCATDADCTVPSDRCLSLDGGHFCGRDCGADNPYGLAAGSCPNGFTCVDAGDGAMQCQPDTLSCSCLPGDGGATRPCVRDNAAGTCYGTETCDETAGWAGCTAQTPALEVCDGVDNDCDLVVDDVPGRGDACQNTNSAGQCDGVLDCAAGEATLQCVGPTPSAEVCNYADDDCDGQTDEGFPDLFAACVAGVGACQADGFYECTADGAGTTCNATAGTASPERCDGVDDDCNGQTDDGPLWASKGQPCTVGDGACAAYGVLVCDPTDPAAAVVCDATPEAAGTETCNGIDDDCDGETDEAADLAGALCPLQGGVCAGATQQCGGTLGFLPCGAAAYGADYEPVEISCDGLDNDCDGQTDEDLPAVSCAQTQGVCAGSTKVCGGTAGWLACDAARYGGSYEASEATCDFLDNDCDGQTDEPFRDATSGAYTDQQNCGTCGSSCDGAVPHGTATCDASSSPPTCAVATCDTGYVAVGTTQCLPSSLGLCDACSTADTCLLPGALCAPLDDGTYCLNPCADDTSCPSGFSCAASAGGPKVCTPDTNACQCDGSNTTLQRSCSATYTPPAGSAYSCFGLQQCTASGWGGCALPAETCNLLDDDCDGQTDEDFKASDGRYASDSNCGACGNNCALLPFDPAPGTTGTTGSCNIHTDPPVCSVTCTSNCFDLDADPANGCECCDPGPDDWPDPAGVDANCDGVDGDVSQALFVAKDGDDANPGTRFAPKLTISAAIAAAAAAGKRDVYVATGVYAEQVTLQIGVSVYGGYSADFGRRDRDLYEVALLPAAPAMDQPGAVRAVGIAGSTAGSTVFDGFSVFGPDEARQGVSSYAIYVRDSDAALQISHNRVYAGRGGPGGRGADGTDGADGGAGGPGVDALDTGVAYGVGEHGCVDADHTSAGGVAGTNTCGGVDTSGGAGGLRRCPVDCSALSSPLPSYCPPSPTSGETRYAYPEESGSAGAAGGTGTSAPGGAGGRDVSQSSSGCNYQTFSTPEGGEGANGTPGQDGASGVGGASGAATLSDGLWVGASGQTGQSGAPGGGGGGGGAGGGSWTEGNCAQFGVDNVGGTGGGGGAGGCEGTAGTGGSAGGGAFGLFVVFSAPPATLPDLSANTLYGGVGGAGGDGGNGGTGGAGGNGAFGGAGGGLYVNLDATYAAFGGGKGGNGGVGGSGGGGGGGAGGDAFLIYATGLGSTDASAWATANTAASAPVGGEGGLGGVSLGNPGGHGDPGASGATHFQ